MGNPPKRQQPNQRVKNAEGPQRVLNTVKNPAPEGVLKLAASRKVGIPCFVTLLRRTITFQA